MTELRTSSRTDWLLIGVLVALVLPLRIWLICNTEVTARDSIGYIRYALNFEEFTWKETLMKHHQHPGYPLLVLLASQPIRTLDDATTPENMELSAQLVNLIAALLLILPMYFLGRQFFGHAVSFGAVLLYQYLPTSAQHLSDGISEPAYLVLLVSGLLHAVHAVRDRTVWRCALCGLFAGLAYLTRPEGALILPAFGGVLIVMQMLPAWRTTWPRFLACGSAAVLSAALVGSIYVCTTGQITNKPAPNFIIGNSDAPDARQMSLGAPGGMHLFAARVTFSDNKSIRMASSVGAIFAEINQGFHYAATVPAILGFLLSFGMLRRQPGFWMIAVFGAIHGVVLVALGMAAAYVSDRHVMIFVLLGCFLAVAGLREVPRTALTWFKIDDGTAWYRSAPVWFALLFVTLINSSLPKATQRLHGNRAGNHAAGLWLSEKIKEGDHVVDDHGWSHFFAGLVFTESAQPVLPKDYVPTCYVVTTRARDPQVDAERHARVIAKSAEVVYVWPAQAEVDKARVVIYAQPRNWETQRWWKSSN